MNQCVFSANDVQEIVNNIEHKFKTEIDELKNLIRNLNLKPEQTLAAKPEPEPTSTAAKYGEEIQFHLADIADIRCTSTADEFSQKALKKLAVEILETGVLLRPLLLKEMGPMELLLLSGDFEYHAAVMANRMDKQRIMGGMVAAMVIKQKARTETQSKAVKQLELWG